MSGDNVLYPNKPSGNSIPCSCTLYSFNASKEHNQQTIQLPSFSWPLQSAECDANQLQRIEMMEERPPSPE